MNLPLILVVSTFCVARGEVHEAQPDITARNGPVLKEAVQSQLCNVNQRKIDTIEKISENEIRTGLKIFKAVAHQMNESFVVSVWDAFTVLSTLRNAAEGRSLQQLNDLFGYSQDCSGISEDKLERIFDRIYDPELSDAAMESQIFHSDQLAVKESFKKDVARDLLSTPVSVPLKDLLDGNAIYSWADSIDIYYEVIPTGSNVDEQSLVIATAAVFRSNFIFDRSSACSLRGAFRYNDVHESEDFQYVRMSTPLNYGEFNYRGNNGIATAQYIVFRWTPLDDFLPVGKIRTIIVLPPDAAHITDLEEYIDYNVIQTLISNSTRHSVIATLPQELTIESSYTLDDVLKNELNSPEMFKKTNDFAKISETGAMKVGPIYHQVEIDQEWDRDFEPCKSDVRSNGKEQKVFDANRAFLIFNVFDDESVFLLSAGRYGWAPSV